jgi:hypothetical protein
VAEESSGISGQGIGDPSLPEGWQPDPWRPESFRWWDGRTWTGRVSSTGGGDRPAGVAFREGGASKTESVRGTKFRATRGKSAPSKTPTSLRTLSAVVATIVVIALSVYGVGTFVFDQMDDAAFARHGVVIQAKVMDHIHDNEGNGTFDYLYVLIPACICSVRVPTTNLAGHPIGSSIGIRYDPKNPVDARPLVDNNNGWLEDLSVLSLYLLLAFFYLAWAVPTNRAWRQRRRAGAVA